MSHLDEFARGCRRRLGLVRVARGVADALQIALACSCALVLLERLVTTGMGLLWAALLPLGAALCVGVGRGLAIWPSMLEAAVTADERLGLQERLSSALAPVDGPMAELLRADAARYVRDRDPLECFPLAASWRRGSTVLLAVGLVVCLLVPQVDLLGWEEERVNQARDSRAVEQAVGEAREVLGVLGRRAAEGAQTETARMLSEYERRLLEMLQQDRRTVQRSAREAASELAARATDERRGTASRQLLAKAAEALGRCAARLARERRGGDGETAKRHGARQAANPLVRAQEYDTARVPAREPEQRWLEACEAAASAMESDAVPRRYLAPVRRYFAPGEPTDPSGRP